MPLVIALDKKPAQGRLADRHRQARRGLAGKAGGGGLLVHADHAVIVTAHPGIRLEGGAACKDLMVRCRHMGMGPDDKRGPAVGIVADRHLFGRRLAMKVYHDEIGVTAELVAHQRAVHRRKDRVVITHEEVGDGVHHYEPLAGVVGDLDRSAPGRSLGHVDRAKQSRIGFDIGDDLALVPDMVSGGQHIDAAGEQLVAD